MTELEYIKNITKIKTRIDTCDRIVGYLQEEYSSNVRNKSNLNSRIYDYISNVLVGIYENIQIRKVKLTEILCKYLMDYIYYEQSLSKEEQEQLIGNFFIKEMMVNILKSDLELYLMLIDGDIYKNFMNLTYKYCSDFSNNLTVSKAYEDIIKRNNYVKKH